jgi:hypothetical protein
MWSDLWSSRWPIWVRLSLVVASVAALGYIFGSISGFDALWFFISVVVLIAAFIAALMAAFRAVRKLLDEHALRSKQRLVELTKDLKDHSAGDLRAIEELYRLQELHIRAAARSLAAALVLLLVSIGFVVSAGHFIDNDAPKIASVATIKQDLADAQKEVGEIDRNITEYLRTNPSAIGKADSSDELRGFTQRQRDLVQYIESLQKAYTSALAALLEVDSQRVNNTNRAVSLLLFRISVLAVTIFTVILLVKAYRANTTMGNVFRGRMIALLVSDHDFESFSLRVATLSAEHVDFGREPKHPIDYMLSTIRELGKVLRPSSPRPTRGKARNPQVEVLPEQVAAPRAEPQAGRPPRADAA